MKKSMSVLILALLLILTGCIRDTSLTETTYPIHYGDFTEEDAMLIMEGIYSNSFVLTNHDELTTFLDEQVDVLSSRFIEDISTYNESYFEENLVVVAYITDRAYSADFCIKNQEFVDNTLRIEIQYHIPWYAFGDSYSDVYAMIIELPKSDTNDITVEITYVDR